MKKMKQLLALVLAVVMFAGTELSQWFSSKIQIVFADSYEYAMFPMQYLNITQGVNGQYSHQGSNAIDNAGKDGGLDNVFAPYTGIIKKIYVDSNGANCVWLESKNKVYYADGTLDYMTMMFVHDNDISDLYVNKEIPQGTVFFQEGTSGWVTGPHVHMECGRGKFDGSGWHANSYGVWMINNSVLPYDALYLSSSTVRTSDYSYNWRIQSNEFSFVPVPKNDFNYRIKNKSTGTYLVADEGKKTSMTNVSVWPHIDGSDEDEWYILEDSLGYKIHQRNGDCVLNPYSDTPTEGTNINIFTFLTGDSTQRWKVSRAGDGYIIHLVYNPNLTLGVENGHNVILKNYNSSDSTQIWYFECLEHIWNSGAVTKAATCTASGVKTYTCTVCGGTKTETVPALGHNWSAWTVTKPATVTEEGIETRTCSRCTAAQTRPIPKLDDPTPTETDLDLEVASVKTQAGKTVTLDVYITKAAPVNYLRLTPVYDKTVLTLTSVKNGDLFDTLEKGASYLFNAETDVTTTGLLATLTFTVAENAEEGDYTVDLSVKEAWDYNEDSLHVGVLPGAITVQNFIYGDVTGDGVIDGRDLVRLRKYLANLDEETGVSSVEIFPGADCTGDGAVDGRDLIRLRKYLANFDEETGTSPIVLGP